MSLPSWPPVFRNPYCLNMMLKTKHQIPSNSRLHWDCFSLDSRINWGQKKNKLLPARIQLSKGQFKIHMALQKFRSQQWFICGCYVITVIHLIFFSLKSPIVIVDFVYFFQFYQFPFHVFWSYVNCVRIYLGLLCLLDEFKSLTLWYSSPYPWSYPEAYLARL